MTPEEKLKICKACNHSVCTSGAVNKCSQNDLVCTASNSIHLWKLVESDVSFCPYNYWNGVAVASDIKSGCGCGR